jgi:hypothetical protein
VWVSVIQKRWWLILQQIFFVPALWRLTFKDFIERVHEIRRWAKGSQRKPEGAWRHDKEGQYSTKGQKEPNGVPEYPKGALWQLKVSSKEPFIHENSKSTDPTMLMFLFHKENWIDRLGVSALL